MIDKLDKSNHEFIYILWSFPLIQETDKMVYTVYNLILNNEKNILEEEEIKNWELTSR